MLFRSQAITTNGSGTLGFTSLLPLTGGTMTGLITFNNNQTFPGVLANGSIGGTSPVTVGGTPSNPIISVDKATTSSLGIVQPDGTTITINGSGVISAGGTLQSITNAGATTTNSITVGGLVLPTSFTPSSSSATGSQGQIAWDSSYFYVCVAPNSWGRIAIDLTPF